MSFVEPFSNETNLERVICKVEGRISHFWTEIEIKKKKTLERGKTEQDGS